ncbi:MAG: DUF58 domain-containing protein [Bacteroidales bacterium]|nr:DUF58 domain-containing protein [Bacteroidales bacterium]
MHNSNAIYRLDEIHDFDNLELIARFVVEGFITGLHRSPYHGFSVEFSEHRQYNTGESTRFVDWKLYARTERLYVKKFEDETNLRNWIVLDTSPSMLFPYQSFQKKSKLAFSIVCAAALINLLRSQRDATGLVLFNDNIELFTKAKISQLHIKYIFDKLKELINKKYEKKEITSNISETLHFVAENVHKRSLIIIFSDLFDSANDNELFSALQHLRFKSHEVILFNVLDYQLEINFEFSNRPYKFIDLETNEIKKINPSEIRTSYREFLTKKFSLIKEKCQQYQIDYIEADINLSFSQVLLPYLLKRNKLF